MLANGIGKLYQRLKLSAHKSTQHTLPMISYICFVALIGHPLYYFLLTEVFPQAYESLLLRIFAATTVLPILFVKYMGKYFTGLLTPYWLFVVVVNLPFTFTFLTLKNDLSFFWILSHFAATFLLILVLYDWFLVMVSFFIGVLLGWVLFVLTTDNSVLDWQANLQYLHLYLFVFIAGNILNYKDRLVKSDEERARLMSSVAGNIAHEVRTPLLSISALKEKVNKLLKLNSHTIDTQSADAIKLDLAETQHYMERIEKETQDASTIIDMILINLGDTKIDPGRFTLVSLQKIVIESIERFPFKSPKQQACVHYDQLKDFNFWGSDILMIHVFFNLIKNSLYSISQANKGEITITTESNAKSNNVIFKDTGMGIPPEVVSQIFNHFFTTKKTNQGFGVGLAFCQRVIQSFGGTIRCYSVYGSYTKFVISLPITHHISNDSIVEVREYSEP